MFTSANEIIKIIEQRGNQGHGLQHFQAYMLACGEPYKTLQCIHVAGTNGKGSTTNYIRSILQQAGYKVGTFTSPYIISHFDRICINNICIEEAVFINIVNMYYDEWIAWDLSMFEIDLCIAFSYFLMQKVEFAMIEVGIGGRLDITNVITPIVSVITNIGYDHMGLLGTTYEQIAFEKAGIIKAGVDVLTGEDKNVCLEVFQAQCKSMKSRCIQMKEITNIEIGKRICFDYGHMKKIALSTRAMYQCKNAALAMETIRYLQEHKGIQLRDEQIREGLIQAIWLGRFEVIATHPEIILDGAHNAHGIRALCDSLQHISNPAIIFSVLKDKNVNEMLSLLETVSDDITICHFQNNRVIDVDTLKHKKHLTVMDSYVEAIYNARKRGKKIVVTGSLYFISEVRKYILSKEFM